MIKLTGLWKSKSTKGISYLSGPLGNARLLIFKNEKKTGKQPDYNLFISEAKTQTENSSMESIDEDNETEKEEAPF